MRKGEQWSPGQGFKDSTQRDIKLVLLSKMLEGNLHQEFWKQLRSLVIASSAVERLFFFKYPTKER